MTPRERSLLILLAAAFLAAGAAIGLDLYFERLTRLDSEFVDLQKRALRAKGAAISSQDPGNSLSLSGLRERFFVPGSLADPLSLAALAQASLKESGLPIVESRVIENSKTAQWIQYNVEGSIEAWFRFLHTLRERDPRCLFRSLSIVKKQDYAYAIAFEVGHAVLP